MKFFFAFILVIATASARGSGPYLPSGWRPKGPAFLLPSEVASSATDPVQDPKFSETEASGSDAFREYGPPKPEEVTLSVKQALPELVTEQAFFIAKSEAAVGDAEKNIVKANEERVAVAAEDVSTANESQATEKQTVEELTTEISDVKPSIEAQPLSEVKQAEEIECEDITDHVDILASTTQGADELTPTAAVERQSSDLHQNVNEIVETIKTEEIKENGDVSTVENIVVPTDAAYEVNNGKQEQSVNEVTQSTEVKELNTTEENLKEIIVTVIPITEEVVTPTTIETQTVGVPKETSDIQSEDIKEDITAPTSVIVEEHNIPFAVIKGQTEDILEQVNETTEVVEFEDIQEQNVKIAPKITILEESVVTLADYEGKTLEVLELEQVKETTEDINEQYIKIAPTSTIKEESLVVSAVPEDQALKVLEEVKESIEAIKSEGVKELENIVVSTAVAEENTITPTTLSALEPIEEISRPINSEEIKKQKEFIIVVEDNVFPTAAIDELVVPLSQQDLVQNDVSYTTSEAALGVTEGVANIIEALINEDEIKTENKAEVSTTPEKPEIPESFLEYNPPGFAVYGPPQQEDLVRTAEVARPVALETNEVRRRRFSPKLRFSRKH